MSRSLYRLPFLPTVLPSTLALARSATASLAGVFDPFVVLTRLGGVSDSESSAVRPTDLPFLFVRLEPLVRPVSDSSDSRSRSSRYASALFPGESSESLPCRSTEPDPLELLVERLFGRRVRDDPLVASSAFLSAATRKLGLSRSGSVIRSSLVLGAGVLFSESINCRFAEPHGLDRTCFLGSSRSWCSV
jgi:hypothetical protein